MTTKLRVLVSSVQKKLEDERLIDQNLVNAGSTRYVFGKPG
jgi:hypothetical protein